MLVGLINGSFYAMLSLGLAIIFGLLGIVNVAQGAFYMLGAFLAWMLLHYLGIGYWPALVLAPLAVGACRHGARADDHLPHLQARSHLRPAADLRPFPVHPGLFVYWYGTAGQPYPVPQALTGGHNLGFMFLPKYRAWVVVASLVLCFATWFAIEKTRARRLSARRDRESDADARLRHQRAAAGDAGFGVGVALAGARRGARGADLQVSPLMGGNIIIIVFAVVVIGGMGSILGSIVTGLALGVLEGLSKVFYPQGSNMVIFVDHDRRADGASRPACSGRER